MSRRIILKCMFRSTHLGPCTTVWHPKPTFCVGWTTRRQGKKVKRQGMAGYMHALKIIAEGLSLVWHILRLFGTKTHDIWVGHLIRGQGANSSRSNIWTDKSSGSRSAALCFDSHAGKRGSTLNCAHEYKKTSSSFKLAFWFGTECESRAKTGLE